MIFINKIIIIVLCVTGGIYSQTLNSICSSTIRSLNEENRNISFTSKPYLCDKTLMRGFYTFGSDASIPNICVTVGSCATDAPYWTPDAQPTASSPGPVSLRICTSISTTGNDKNCHFDCNLRVTAAFCNHLNAVVYDLSPVKICSQRYCFANNDLKPCEENESSPTGYQPCTSTFPFGSLKNTLTTYGIPETEKVLKDVPGVSLICKIKCPPNLSCNGIDGEVFWYSKSKTEPIKEEKLYYDASSNELYSYLYQDNWSSYLNNEFYCSITPKLDGNRPFKNIVTPKFYSGLLFNVKDPNGLVSVIQPSEGSSIKLTLHEADTRFSQVDVYSTIPILCNQNAASCGLDIQLVTDPSFSGRDKIRLINCAPSDTSCKGCARTLKSQLIPNANNVASFKLIGTIDDKNNQLRETINVNFKTKYHEVLKPAKRQLPPPPMPAPVFAPAPAGNGFGGGGGGAGAGAGFGGGGAVAFIPVNLAVAQGQFFNDPHIKTHDGTEIEFHGRDGEYLMMENKDAHLRIHTISRLCSSIYTGSYLSHVYCNFALYIQSFDDYIYYELPNPQRLYYKDLSNFNSPLVMLAFDPRTGLASIPKASPVKISMDNEYYKIVTHFSTTIKIHRANNNYYVNPSKFDFGRVHGVLGNYNGIAGDDITNTRCGRVATENAFLDCYRVTSPLLSQRQFYQIPPPASITQYCSCATTTPVCSYGLRQDDVRTNFIGKRSISNTEDKKYGLTFETLDIITKKTQAFDSVEKNNNQLFNKQLRVGTSSSYCQPALNTTVFRECYKQQLIDLPELIKLCENDFKDSKLDWSATYYALALDECKTKLLNDINNYVNSSNGMSVPQLNILSDLCSFNCNNNGDCVGGQCYCNPPFSGFDCSIDTSKPLKILKSSSENDICNTKITSTCTDVVISVNRILPELTIAYEIFYKSSKGGYESLHTENPDIYMISENVLYLNVDNNNKIPDGSLSVYYVNITIKDTRVSEPLTYAIIDGDCHECKHSFDCVVKPNKCDINSICYNAKDKNPKNSNEICDPSRSSLGWSPISVAPSVTTTTTKPSEATSTSKPSEATTTTKPSEATTTTKPSEATSTTKPSEATSTSKPSELTTTTKQSEETSTSKPSEPTTTTKPSEATSTSKPSEETSTSKPSETTKTSKLSETEESTKPNEATTTTKPNETEEPTKPNETTTKTKPNKTEEPTKPNEPNSAQWTQWVQQPRSSAVNINSKLTITLWFVLLITINLIFL